MYFYEVLNSIDIEKSIEFFLEFCSESPDIYNTRKNIVRVIDDLKSLQPNKDDDFIIHVGIYSDDNIVELIDNRDGKVYGIMTDDWSNVLGYTVDNYSIKKYGKEYFVALVLWEMTWLGFDEKTIQEYVKSWDEE